MWQISPLDLLKQGGGAVPTEPLMTPVSLSLWNPCTERMRRNIVAHFSIDIHKKSEHSMQGVMNSFWWFHFQQEVWHVSIPEKTCPGCGGKWGCFALDGVLTRMLSFADAETEFFQKNSVSDRFQVLRVYLKTPWTEVQAKNSSPLKWTETLSQSSWDDFSFEPANWFAGVLR